MTATDVVVTALLVLDVVGFGVLGALVVAPRGLAAHAVCAYVHRPTRARGE